MNNRLIISTNTDKVFLLHRLQIGLEALEQGYKVYVVTKDSGCKTEIENYGFEFINWDIRRGRLNPFFELKSLLQLKKIYNKIKPCLIYNVALKPIIYGNIVAKFFNINTVNGFSGLGYIFTSNNTIILKKIVSFTLKLLLRNTNNHSIFENSDDPKEFLKRSILSENDNYTIVRGVGVNLNKYKPTDDKNNSDKIKIVLPARMLWDKGIREYVEAAQELYAECKGVVLFQLCGGLDYENKNAIPESYLNHIFKEDYLEWIGHQSDMKKVYKNSDIVVLPSYREGLPTVLLEACASGLPIVTVNSIGCKECVDNNINGFIVSVKSSKSLAEAMKKLIFDRELRKSMGVKSRDKAESQFSIQEVVKTHLFVFRSFCIHK